MLLCFAAFSVTVLTSCEDEPDKYEVTGGSPTIHYIRLSDVTKKDSMLTGAYMGANICIVGENLTSIKKMYFNDQEAILNTSFMTYHTLLVDIPTTLTDNPTNKIYMVNSENDTTTYDFTVLVPNPVVSSISNEFAADGEEVTIKGDYLLNYESYPLEITFAGNIPVTEFTSYSKTSVTFKVPEDAQKGYVTVESMYGKSRSKFYFRDDRNILFDWDDDGDEALSSGHGWRNGNVRNDVDGVTPLDGNYLYFGGATLNFDTWNEDAFSFNYWPDTDNGYPELTSIINGSDISQLQLKFEVNIPVAWSACSMQLIFTGNDQVTYNTGTNSYIADDTYPRALWTPWYGTESGSYTTSGWETVTIPLSDFAYDRYGNKLDALKIENMTGLTFFLYTGPYKDSSVECSPVVCIDNIRIAPIE
ncbi:MAG: glycan-binding surface protein [Prevotellaceae bacterium]|nr:glycan-binding surface protein [Prevotellaceae bacterium]